MFLNNLNDKQKKLFLTLAIKAADASGGISFEEKNMLKLFAMEMNIEPQYSSEDDLDEVINELFNCSTAKELQIVLFELLGIMYSDADYDEQEQQFVDRIAERFEIGSEKIKRMDEEISKYSSLYKEICGVVLN